MDWIFFHNFLNDITIKYLKCFSYLFVFPFVFILEITIEYSTALKQNKTNKKRNKQKILFMKDV